jgi:hypothetical protein
MTKRELRQNLRLVRHRAYKKRVPPIRQRAAKVMDDVLHARPIRLAKVVTAEAGR